MARDLVGACGPRNKWSPEREKSSDVGHWDRNDKPQRHEGEVHCDRHCSRGTSGVDEHVEHCENGKRDTCSTRSKSRSLSL